MEDWRKAVILIIFAMWWLSWGVSLGMVTRPTQNPMIFYKMGFVLMALMILVAV